MLAVVVEAAVVRYFLAATILVVELAHLVFVLRLVSALPFLHAPSGQ